MKTQAKKTGYDKYLSSLDVWAIAFGCIVGWGAFVMPGTTFLPMAGPAGTLIGMVISMAIMLVIGANYAYLMNRRPGRGGVYAYIKEAFGRDHAFLCSWFLCLSYLTIVFLNGTSLFVVIRTLFNDLLQKGYHYTISGNVIYLEEVAVSVVVLAVIGVLLIVAKPLIRYLHTILSIILLAGTVIVTVICLKNGHLGDAISTFGYRGFHKTYAISTIVLLAPWAFVGFEVICLETAHFKFSHKKSLGIMILAIILGGFVYTSMAFVSISSVPDGYDSWQSYFQNLGAHSGVEAVPTFHVAETIMGKTGLIIMGLTAFSAILTGIIGAYRATTHLLSAMAEDHILSEKFTITSYSIMFIMAISIVISFLGKNALEWFVDLTSVGAIAGFGYASISTFKFARMEKNRKLMVCGILGAIITFAFGVVQMIPNITPLEAMNSEAFFLLSLWCLLGFVFYWRMVNSSALMEYSGVSTSGVVLFSLLIYSILMWMGKILADAKSLKEVNRILNKDSIVLLLIIFMGLMVMLYIQNYIRKRHEEIERERIKAEARNSAKSQFLFNMSHDIRTPMNAIIGFTHLALKDNASIEEKNEFLHKIDSSGQQLLRIINDVLDMSYIESGKMVLNKMPMNIVEVFKDMEHIFDTQMQQKKIHFTVDYSDIRDRWVSCDKNRFSRVLLNMLSNAYKFTPEGGTVSMVLRQIEALPVPDNDNEETAASGKAEKTAEGRNDSAAGGKTGKTSDGTAETVLEGESAGQETAALMAHYELRVKDNGIGMSKEFLEHAFVPFEREKTSTISGIQGTGLGLSITHGIVKSMGGDIKAFSEQGKGTEFVITVAFECIDEPEEAVVKDAEEDDEKQVSLEGIRVLLVEDNEINQEIATMILEQEGMVVETAWNGKEAVEKVSAAEPGQFQLILMDIQMPVMDGYSATRAIRSLDNPALASIPIVAMTANAFKEDEEAAREAGMQAHVAKPLDVEMMMKILKEQIKAQTH